MNEDPRPYQEHIIIRLLDAGLSGAHGKVGSPGDVARERDIVSSVFEEINSGLARAKGLVCEVWRWETDAYPQFHPEGPQGAIDRQLQIDNCDLLIGVFWKRFGTPLKNADSGTEHEIRVGYAAWQAKRRPQIMLYFNKKPYSPHSQEELDQWGKVLAFKSESQKAGLLWDYTGTKQFETMLRQHMTKSLLNKIKDNPLSLMMMPLAKGTEPREEDHTAVQITLRSVLEDLHQARFWRDGLMEPLEAIAKGRGKSAEQHAIQTRLAATEESTEKAIRRLKAARKLVSLECGIHVGKDLDFVLSKKVCSDSLRTRFLGLAEAPRTELLVTSAQELLNDIENANREIDRISGRHRKLLSLFKSD